MFAFLLATGYVAMGLQLISKVHSQEAVNYEKQLYQDLTRSPPAVRPPTQHTEPLHVQLGLDLSHIIALDERTEILSVNVWMRFLWYDPQLRWDPAQYGGIDVIHVPDNAIWKPDITLYNSAEASRFHPFGGVMAVVTSRGLVMWVPPATLRSICPVDLRHYPFDEQTCELRFGSWTYDVVKLNVTLFGLEGLEDPAEMNLMTQIFDQNNEWELMETSAQRTEQHYDCCPEVYPNVRFHLRLRRRSAFHKFTLVVPSLITMVLTLVLFWLPPMAGEKIMLGGVNCVLLMLLLNHLSWRLPNNGSNAPAIVMFCSNSMLFTALSFVLSVSTITMSRTHSIYRLPRRLENWFDGILGKVLCLGGGRHRKKSSQVPPDAKLLSCGSVELTIEQSESSSPVVGSGGRDSDGNHGRWILLATALDRTFFYVYAFVYIIIISVTSAA